MNDSAFITKKSLGQHFLTSDIVPEWMCTAADIQAGDKVLEIGPGTGALTSSLLKAGAQVIAVEADSRALTRLKQDFASALTSDALQLHHADVRHGSIDSYIPNNTPYKVVANIPYYLSGYLIRAALTAQQQPQTIVFLIQKEVAKRATAPNASEKKESLLSLATKAYGTPQYIKTVRRGHFAPPPRVDSAILCISDISRDFFTDIDEDLFFSILHIGFGSKRKQLLANLSVYYDRTLLQGIFTERGIDPKVRAEDVPLATWQQLVHSLSTVNPKSIPS